jgi:hypothetical protein
MHLSRAYKGKSETSKEKKSVDQALFIRNVSLFTMHMFTFTHTKWTLLQHLETPIAEICA